MLGGHIGRRSAETAQTRDRRHVHDAAATALGQHLPQLRAQGPERAGGVDAHHDIPVGIRRLVDARHRQVFLAGIVDRVARKDRVHHTGIVQRAVKTAEVVHRRLDHGVADRRFGNVAFHENGLTAFRHDAVDDRLAFLGQPIHRHHVRAFACKTDCRKLTHATGATRHKGRLADKATGHEEIVGNRHDVLAARDDRIGRIPGGRVRPECGRFRRLGRRRRAGHAQPTSCGRHAHGFQEIAAGKAVVFGGAIIHVGTSCVKESEISDRGIRRHSARRPSRSASPLHHCRGPLSPHRREPCRRCGRGCRYCAI